MSNLMVIHHSRNAGVVISHVSILLGDGGPQNAWVICGDDNLHPTNKRTNKRHINFSPVEEEEEEEETNI